MDHLGFPFQVHEDSVLIPTMTVPVDIPPTELKFPLHSLLLSFLLIAWLIVEAGFLCETVLTVLELTL